MRAPFSPLLFAEIGLRLEFAPSSLVSWIQGIEHGLSLVLCSLNSRCVSVVGGFREICAGGLEQRDWDDINDGP